MALHLLQRLPEDLQGDRYRGANEAEEAEAWYRRVLANSPLHPGATGRLAELLASRGEGVAARQLCANSVERTGSDPECARIIGEMRHVGE